MINTAQKVDFYLVGIGNHSVPVMSDEVLLLIKNTKVFSGGKRHYQLVENLLPKNHIWIEISGRIDVVIQKYVDTEEVILIFASGDPFFYGFGNTLKSCLPNAKMKSFPYFNSIQRLCQKVQKNYNNLVSVSVHGRDWSALDTALIKGSSLIGVLTDYKKSPSAIADRLYKYGFDNYKIIVGEALDGEDENIHTFNVVDCKFKEFQKLNCVLLEKTHSKKNAFGIADSAFISLPKRSNMITKMPVRLCTLNALNLGEASSFWDIGSCTGSIAIEAKRHFPHLVITAFEKREECKEIIQQNKENFSTPGIEVVIDDFFNLDLSKYLIPDVVFIGGHGNRLKEMIEKIYEFSPSTRFVTNAVKETTSTTFTNELTKLDYTINNMCIQVDNHNKITIHTAVKN